MKKLTIKGTALDRYILHYNTKKKKKLEYTLI